MARGAVAKISVPCIFLQGVLTYSSTRTECHSSRGRVEISRYLSSQQHKREIFFIGTFLQVTCTFLRGHLQGILKGTGVSLLLGQLLPPSSTNLHVGLWLPLIVHSGSWLPSNHTSLYLRSFSLTSFNYIAEIDFDNLSNVWGIVSVFCLGTGKRKACHPNFHVFK